MKITADVQEYAAGLSDNEKAALYSDLSAEALAKAEDAKRGTAQMSEKFRQMAIKSM